MTIFDVFVVYELKSSTFDPLKDLKEQKVKNVNQVWMKKSKTEPLLRV